MKEVISAVKASELNHKYGYRKEGDKVINHIFMEGDDWESVKEYIKFYFPNEEID